MVSNGRRLFLLGMAGTAVVLSGCGGGGGSDTVTPAPNEPAPPDPDPGTPPEPPTQPPAPQPDSHPPRGLHVSLEDSTRRTRTVTWFSDGNEAPAQRLEYDQPEADWDPQSVQSRPFLKWVYARSEPTFGVEALTHRAMAPALDPRRPFRYRVGSPEGGWSRVY
ncbi:MAG TPA: serine/threonine protein phosphatase, partial [Alcanivorax sp.]|nr:serine/threonine protein phosphatase [Alcanivorax sp.]